MRCFSSVPGYDIASCYWEGRAAGLYTRSWLKSRDIILADAVGSRQLSLGAA